MTDTEMLDWLSNHTTESITHCGSCVFNWINGDDWDRVIGNNLRDCIRKAVKAVVEEE